MLLTTMMWKRFRGPTDGVTDTSVTVVHGYVAELSSQCERRGKFWRKKIAITEYAYQTKMLQPKWIIKDDDILEHNMVRIDTGKAELCRLNEAQETKMICMVQYLGHIRKSVERLTLIIQYCDLYSLQDCLVS